MATETDRLKLLADIDDKISPQLAKMAARMKGMEAQSQKLQRMGDTFRRIGIAAAGMTAAFVGVRAASDFLSSSIRASQEQEDAMARLASTMKATGKSFPTEAANAFASSLQRITTFGDERILEVMNLLGTFKMNADQIRATTPLILDVTAALKAQGVTAEQTAVMLGKAFETGNIGALRRVGINVNQAKFELQGFNAVLEELRRTYGGAAEAMAGTSSGKMLQAMNAWGDFKETVGALATSILGRLAPSILRISERMNEALASTSGFQRALDRIFSEKNIKTAEAFIGFLAKRIGQNFKEMAQIATAAGMVIKEFFGGSLSSIAKQGEAIVKQVEARLKQAYNIGWAVQKGMVGPWAEKHWKEAEKFGKEAEKWHKIVGDLNPKDTGKERGFADIWKEAGKVVDDLFKPTKATEQIAGITKQVNKTADAFGNMNKSPVTIKELPALKAMDGLIDKAKETEKTFTGMAKTLETVLGGGKLASLGVKASQALGLLDPTSQLKRLQKTFTLGQKIEGMNRFMAEREATLRSLTGGDKGKKSAEDRVWDEPTRGLNFGVKDYSKPFTLPGNLENLIPSTPFGSPKGEGTDTRSPVSVRELVQKQAAAGRAAAPRTRDFNIKVSGTGNKTLDQYVSEMVKQGVKAVVAEMVKEGDLPAYGY